MVCVTAGARGTGRPGHSGKSLPRVLLGLDVSEVSKGQLMPLEAAGDLLSWDEGKGILSDRLDTRQTLLWLQFPGLL